MDWLGRIDITLLSVLLANTLFIACHRFYRYRRAPKQSCDFIRDAGVALRAVRFNEVIAIAAENRLSHVASVVAGGLRACASAPPQFSEVEGVDAAQRALRRARRMLGAHLKTGLGTLRTIAATAPFVGLIGTCFGILGAFRGYSGLRSGMIAMAASYIAQALIATAGGLVVAIPATWFYNHFHARVDVFESEMANPELEAITYLNAHGEWRRRATARPETLDGRDSPDVRSWEAPYDRQWALLLGIGLSALYVWYLFALGVYWHFASPF